MLPALLLALPGLCQFAPTTIPQRQGEPLALVRYGQDISLRDCLIREPAVSVYADLGSHVVARVSAARAAGLGKAGIRVRGVPEPGRGEQLAAVSWTKRARPPSGVRILLKEKSLYLVSGTPGNIADLHQPGVFHGGIVRIPLDQPYREAAGVVAPLPEAVDPRISALVAKVQKANLVRHIQALSNLWTRRANQPENAQAITYVKTELAKLPNLTVKTETFRSYYGPNVIAELRGLEKPTEIVMVGAHIDSYVRSSSRARAPGADDNASGSASVLELARILSQAPMQRTIRFAWWNAEEYGLVGSAAYAAAARVRGDKIIAYLNTDMNAYRASGDTVDVDFITNDSTASLISQLSQISKTYVPTLGVKSGSFSRGTSDHRSFFRNGFPAVFYFEDLDKYSPYIHTSNDNMTLSTNDMDLSTLITQSVAAGLTALALPLEVPAFKLSVTSGPTVGYTEVVASGNFLASTTAVKVGGKSVPFTPGTTVKFATPTSANVGAVKVEIANAAGPGSATFTYKLTSPSALRMPVSLPRGKTVIASVGGQPGYDCVTIVSDKKGSTPLGYITLDLGAGNVANLYLFNFGKLSPGGGTHQFGLPVPTMPWLSGLYFYLQTGSIAPGWQSVHKTNLVTVQIQ
ncbi:MAG: M28 family metallopeptidase [Planctomycetota bacterium]|jgi:Zn-dependent M28 family amino/carboxypeptidase